jgi:ArsR family transcriptional regulator, arsenate/arsenite/antimonite-responsive transcriptional repressor
MGYPRFSHFKRYQNMDEGQVVKAFAALAQDTRLRIVRLLVQAGASGLAAGGIADELGLERSNASFHLAQLEKARLINSRRDGRSIIYTAAYPVLGDLIRFLMEDCCAGDRRVLSVCSPKRRARPAPALA